MSSNIPARRTTRTTRNTVPKENENAIAIARPSRVTSRVKPPSTATSAATATGAITTRATTATAASRAKANETKADPAAGKRKREALGEVTALVANNKPKPITSKAVKVKETEAVVAKDKFDGVVLKPTARVPLRPVTVPVRRPTRTTASAKEIKQEIAKVEEEKDENAMVIDAPHLTANRILNRKSIALQTSLVEKELEARRRTSKILIAKQQEEEELETRRVFKKRRTSSDAPEAPLEDDRLDQESEDAAARVAAELDTEAEADPEGPDWVDLDAEDSDDPLMVSEYVTDIFNYLKEIEQTTMPNPNYMESQKELAWKMRGILTDWLIQVHLRFRLLPETLFLCVNIIDRFLSARVVSLAKLQLVGVTCMFIAAKFEEIVSPSVKHFLYCADSSYTEAEILQAERYVLKTLDWNLSYPNPVHYLRRISKADDYDVKVRTIGKYFLEIGCLEWRLIAAPPSLMAAASIWLARLVLGHETWTPNLAHYSSYAESSLILTANLMLNYILKPNRHESFYKKYASKRYFKSSIYVREWALDRWPENCQVSLAQDLPMIKARIRMEREALEAAGEAHVHEDDV